MARSDRATLKATANATPRPAPPRPTTATLRATRRAELQATLSQAMERLLAAGESYAMLSVERIINEAGVSRSLFYRYFEDKGDLLRGMVGDIFAEMMEAGRMWWTSPPEARRSEFSSALRVVVETYRHHGTLLGAVADAATQDDSLRELYASMGDTISKGIENHIRRGQEGGSISRDIAPESTATWLTWMVERGLYKAVRSAPDEDVDAYIDALVHIIWSALYGPTGSPS